MNTKNCILACMMSSVALFSTAPLGEAQEPYHVITGKDIQTETVTKDVPQQGITLTVKLKHQNPHNEKQDSSLDVRGLVFQLDRVSGVDVSDPKKRAELSTIDEEQAAQFSYESPVTEKTNMNGQVVFTDLHSGLYRLTDTSTGNIQFVMLPLETSDGSGFETDSYIVMRNIPRTPPVVKPPNTTPDGNTPGIDTEAKDTSGKETSPQEDPTTAPEQDDTTTAPSANTTTEGSMVNTDGFLAEHSSVLYTVLLSVLLIVGGFYVTWRTRQERKKHQSGYQDNQSKK